MPEFSQLQEDISTLPETAQRLVNDILIDVGNNDFTAKARLADESKTATPTVSILNSA